MVSDSLFDTAFFDSNGTYSSRSGLFANNKDGSQLSLWSSTFSNNHVGSGSTAIWHAALRVASGGFTVHNTTFVNNASQQWGEAAAVGGSVVDLQGSLVDCLFVINSALVDAGGVTLAQNMEPH